MIPWSSIGQKERIGPLVRDSYLGIHIIRLSSQLLANHEDYRVVLNVVDCSAFERSPRHLFKLGYVNREVAITRAVGRLSASQLVN